MPYCKEFEVYSHDVGHNRLARPAAVLRYLQETAVHQMRDEKPSYRELFEKGQAFILSRLNLQLYHPLYEYERVIAQSWACSEHGASFGRSYRLLRGKEIMAEAVGVWALVNMKTGTLVRAEDAGLHYTSGKALPLPVRFRFPADGLTEVAERPVLYEDIDCNGHLNNTHYPDWLCDTLLDIDCERVTGVQIHYLVEAPLGERLTILRGEESVSVGRSYVFETRRTDGMANVRARITTCPIQEELR